MRMLIALTFVSVFLSFPSSAEEAVTNSRGLVIPKELVGTRWENLNIPPGTTVTEKITKDGKTSRTLHFPHGVTISENGGDGYMGVDHSEYGAVLCGWMIYSSIYEHLKRCSPASKPQIEAFKSGVERINDFIVANSLEPVTKEELENSIRLRAEEEAKRSLPGQDSCVSEFYSGWDSKSVEEIKAQINKMLSVPRVPVTNPCL